MGCIMHLGPEVEVLHNPSARRLFDDFIVHRRPAVLRGAIARSPAFEEWTDDVLQTKYGDLRVKLEGRREKTGERAAELSGSSYGTARLRDFFEKESLRNAYVVSQLPDQMAQDVLVPDPMACGTMAGRMLETNLWVSDGDTRSLLHRDADNVLNCVLRGQKEWVLIDPVYAEHLPLAREKPGEVGGFALFDPERVDAAEFPKLRNITYQHATAQAGDCLFLPWGYFHQVTSPPPRNLAVTLLYGVQFQANFDGCPPAQPKSLKELPPVWTYDGEGWMSMGNTDPETIRTKLVSWFARDGADGGVESVEVDAGATTHHGGDDDTGDDEQDRDHHHHDEGHDDDDEEEEEEEEEDHHGHGEEPVLRQARHLQWDGRIFDEIVAMKEADLNLTLSDTAKRLICAEWSNVGYRDAEVEEVLSRPAAAALLLDRRQVLTHYQKELGTAKELDALPPVAGGSIEQRAAENVDCLIAALDTSGDGRLSLAEVRGAAGRDLARCSPLLQAWDPANTGEYETFMITKGEVGELLWSSVEGGRGEKWGWLDVEQCVNDYVEELDGSSGVMYGVLEDLHDRMIAMARRQGDKKSLAKLEKHHGGVRGDGDGEQDEEEYEAEVEAATMLVRQDYMAQVMDFVLEQFAAKHRKVDPAMEDVEKVKGLA